MPPTMSSSSSAVRASSNGSGLPTATSGNRIGRLVQLGGSRLAFQQPRPAAKFGTNNVAPGSLAFAQLQQQNKQPSASLSNRSTSAMEDNQQAYFIAQQVIPSANTSGLPVPKSSGQLNGTGSRNTNSSTKLPSTVRSALRVQLPSGGRTGEQRPSTANANYHLSARPFEYTPTAGPRRVASGQQLNTKITSRTTTFALRFQANQHCGRPNAGSAQQTATDCGSDNENDDDDDETGDVAKCVKSLPQLKSTSYFGRLSSVPRMSACSAVNGAKHQHEESPPSEPISTKNRSSFASSKHQIPNGGGIKPSQLVKPMVGGSCLEQKQQQRDSIYQACAKPRSNSLTASSVNKTSYTSSTLDCSNHSSHSTALREPDKASAFVSSPTSVYGSSANHWRYASSMPAPNISNKSPSANAVHSTPRSGLQSLVNSSTVLKNSSEQKEEEPPQQNEESKSSGQQDYQADQEDTDFDENEGVDDEDDATTATTMTQMSDSNELASANRELNSMIQMLTSKAIISESDQNIGEQCQQPLEQEQEQKKRIKQIGSSLEGNKPVKQSDKVDLAETRCDSYDNNEAFQSQLARVKSVLQCRSPVVKSQSVSFGVGAKIGQPMEQPMRKSRLMSMQQDGPIYMQTKQPLSRPRSRVIFDPTSSQFHISCSEEPATDSDLQSNAAVGQQTEQSDGDSTTESSNSSYASNADELLGLIEQKSEDEASRSLMATQSKILSLKYLPTPATVTNSSQQSSNGDSNTIMRLKDCRGSLDSLASLATSSLGNQQKNKHQQQLAIVNQQSLERRKSTRSPVGQAIRSLFGRSSNQQQQQSVDESSGQAQASKITRHASLRSDPRQARTSQLVPKKQHQQQQQQPPTQEASCQLDLLQRASKRLSVSSNSLTSKFKHIMIGSSAAGGAPTANVQTKMEISSPIKVSQTRRVVDRQTNAS